MTYTCCTSGNTVDAVGSVVQLGGPIACEQDSVELAGNFAVFPWPLKECRVVAVLFRLRYWSEKFPVWSEKFPV